MNILIRQEKPRDYKVVFSLTEQAFREMEFSTFDEQFMVERLRKSKAFVPELSLVAVYRGNVIGHILLSKVTIKNNEQEFPSLVLAPVSVLPKYQRKRVGSMLIKEAHRIACMLGYTSVVLVGHPEFYPRFGYKKASDYGITFPFDAPDECCMVAELTEGALEGVSGVVEHPGEFASTGRLSVSL